MTYRPAIAYFAYREPNKKRWKLLPARCYEDARRYQDEIMDKHPDWDMMTLHGGTGRLLRADAAGSFLP